jgi:MAC/Perforin domain
MSQSQISNPIPGWDKILGGVNVKTAAFSDPASIGNHLYEENAVAWQQVPVLQTTYNVPSGFEVSVIDQSEKVDVIGQSRDEYMNNLAGKFGVKGSYGAFSGTVNAQFGITQDRTRAYSFGTHTDRLVLYSLNVPTGLSFSSGFLNEQFVNDLYTEPMGVQDFYDKYGTHFTSSILVGGRASLSLYSQYDKAFDETQFHADLSAAYESVAASFEMTGDINYTSKSTQETYHSNSQLNLLGGDPTTTDMKDWLKTVMTSPTFVDFNTAAAFCGLTPMYMLIPDPNDKRRQDLKDGLADYLYPPLHVRIFAAASTLTERPEAFVTVPEYYKVLSGGARSTWGGAGEMLTASFPVSSNQWAARAGDCVTPDSGILTVFAIAVYDPYNWLDVTTKQSQSQAAGIPTTSVDLDNNYVLTGGGAECVTGCYLTASYPYSHSDPRNTPFPSNTWQVAAKAHFVPVSGPITVYAVGVKWSSSFLSEHGNQPAITTECIGLDSSLASHPEVSVGSPDQTTLVGGGAYDRWQGQGNLLTDLHPEDSSNWHAAGKDHIDASPAVLTVYAIGVKNMVPPPSP